MFVSISFLFFFYLLFFICLQSFGYMLSDIKYSYRIQIIYTQYYGFKFIFQVFHSNPNNFPAIYDNTWYSLVLKTYGEYDAFCFFFLGKCNFPFTKI